MQHIHSSRRLAEFIAAVQADGARASYWAEHCAWIPGDGYCPRAHRSDCRDQCFFRWMRDRELTAVIRQRMRRRLQRLYAVALLGWELACLCCPDVLLLN